MFNIKELVDDLIRNRYVFNIRKYWRKISKDLKISTIMDYIRQHQLFESFVETEDQVEDTSYETPIFLVQTTDQKYEFFTLEDRGAHIKVMKFDRLEDAVRYKVEYYLCTLGHEASDAIYPFE